MELDEYSAFGHEVVAAAGRIAAAGFRRVGTVHDKAKDARRFTASLGRGGAFDPVTEVDRRVEDAVRARIAERYPHHGVVGEERGVAAGSSAWSWVVDPIDGTRAYIAGLPTWGCLLGLLRDGEPMLGWMHQPVVGETFFGDGDRAWVARDGGRVGLAARAAVTRLPDALLAATHPAMFAAAARRRFDVLAGRVRQTLFGGDCYNYCLLAHGLLDLVVEDDLKPHDVLPLVPIVRGAGGVVTDLDGATPRCGVAIAAGNAALHRQALAIMRG